MIHAPKRSHIASWWPALLLLFVPALCACGEDETSEAAQCTGRFLNYGRRVVERCGTAELADLYNQATGTPPSFEEWKASRCLADEYPHQSLDYFNDGDLNLGRDLHMNTCANGVISAYVSNLGMPGQTIAAGVHALEQGGAPVAVAMDYIPNRPEGPEYAVQFYVFKQSGGDGVLDTNLQFDSEGIKYSPFACTVCHGGAYDPSSGLVRGASFLPLMKEALYFTFVFDFEKEEILRVMNTFIANASALPSIHKLIDTAYPAGVHQAGSPYVRDQVPASWKGDEEFYSKVALKYCINCHAAHPAFPFNTREEMLSAGAINAACRRKELEPYMPQSEAGHVAFQADSIALGILGCP